MKPKIIVIDDDAAMTELMSILLTTQGFIVTEVNSSKDGLGLIRENKYDLVMVDLMMPEMDGWELCRQIRNFSQVPILVLSAVNDPSLVASSLDAGADDFLVKPTPSRVVVAHINGLLRRNGTAPLTATSNTVTKPARSFFPRK